RKAGLSQWRKTNEPANTNATGAKRCAARIQNANPRPETETRPTSTQKPWRVTESSAASDRPLVRFPRDTRRSADNASRQEGRGPISLRDTSDDSRTVSCAP